MRRNIRELAEVKFTVPCCFTVIHKPKQLVDLPLPM